MPELTREEKIKLLEKLSPHLQELMTSEDTGATLLYLGQKYHLSDHQVSLISKILGDVALGVTPAISLPLEISAKAAVDMQTAGGLAQDLNDLMLSPKPVPVTSTPATPLAPFSLPPVPPTPPAQTNQYREQPVVSRIEPITGPEIIDLRKTPPPPIQMPVAAAPIPPKPMPLIEAEPHKTYTMPPAPITTTTPADTYRESIPSVTVPAAPLMPAMNATPKEPLPQYIIRPPGLPPTDLPRDVLDLRRGEEKP
ncbi:MAG: hypothetical protein Q7K16_01360 [Candidatus Azambacteria bacterium]|nr:hypothetical protein [Candidatus Azambacteria bacterium]